MMKNKNIQFIKRQNCLHSKQLKVNNNHYATPQCFPSLSALWQAGIRGVGKLTVLIVFMLLISVMANAQPLPPTTPSGNPVPVEDLLVLLPAVFMALGIIRLRKKK